MTTQQSLIWGTGRRKTAVARVSLAKGTGLFTCNGRPVDEYFVRENERIEAWTPLKLTKTVGRFDIHVNAQGGGFASQAGAISLGLSRALLKAQPDLEEILRGKGLLTRDSRMKERKHFGRRGARRSFQFSKR